ncbi:hypothetical protein FQN54_001629 [Arachnomyces sp. PD_36]|nr:hypothetical protein FQN54_001629 [Arachnomyces sp. PD_36]
MLGSQRSQRPAAVALVKVLLLAISQIPLIRAVPTPLFYALDVEEGKPPSDPSLWLYLGIAAALVLSGGAFAGLTIALMGQDEIYLQVISTSGEASEKKNAASVLKLLKKGKHWVLVSLLLSNVITNETLPIVLDRSLGGGWPAVLGSTALIVIFGEVVPQSICVRFGLPIGAWMAPCVLFLMYITAPLSWPIAKLLDRLLGEDHGTTYKKAGLKTLVTLHKTLGAAGEQLNSDEVTIISAVLDLKDKSVGSIMTPMGDVFTMSTDTVLDEDTINLILSQGYSRIPIHAPENPLNFVGMLLVKMLITYDPEDCKLVRDFALATLPETRAETSCLDIVNFFQEGKSHMVLVSEYPGEDYGALGVVTLEDVIEELIGEEIIDESDVFIDVHKAIRRLAPAPKARVPKGHIVTDPPDLTNAMKAGDLVDVTPASPFPPLHRTETQNSTTSLRKTSTVSHNSPPQTTFYLRNSNADGGEDAIAQRGPTPDIRERLKHLGPSNLASRPRQTRYHAVKIKPGGSPAVSNSLSQTDTERANSESHAPSETQGSRGDHSRKSLLLGSAGMEAKDGVHALKSGYGTMGDSETGIPKTGRSIEAGPNEHLPDMPLPEAEDDGEIHHAISSQSEGVQSDASKNQGYYQPRGPTRSGSITEQFLDINGVRKLVLQTTSSNSSQSGDGKSRTDDKPAKSPRKGSQGSDNDDATGGGNNYDEPSEQSVKKKRRRKKRYRGSKQVGSEDPESRPLLDS